METGIITPPITFEPIGTPFTEQEAARGWCLRLMAPEHRQPAKILRCTDCGDWFEEYVGGEVRSYVGDLGEYQCYQGCNSCGFKRSQIRAASPESATTKRAPVAIEVPEHFKDADLNNVTPANLRAWAEKWPHVKRRMMIIGEPGRGKTYLLWAIAKRLAQSGFRPVCLRAADMRNAWSTACRSYGPERLVTFWHTTPYLLIDDLCATAAADTWTGVLHDVLDHRINNELATFLTLDMDGPHLAEKFSDAIRSRLNMFENKRICGADRRVSVQEAAK